MNLERPVGKFATIRHRVLMPWVLDHWRVLNRRLAWRDVLSNNTSTEMTDYILYRCFSFSTFLQVISYLLDDERQPIAC